MAKTNKTRFKNTGDKYNIGIENYHVVYDSVTSIVYLVSERLHGGSISPLYNSKGVPMSIDEYHASK